MDSVTLMPEAANPLIPVYFDVVMMGISFALLALMIVAIVSVVRHIPRMSSERAVLWVLVVVFLSPFGAAAWFLIGRPHARRPGITSPFIDV